MKKITSKSLLFKIRGFNMKKQNIILLPALLFTFSGILPTNANTVVQNQSKMTQAHKSLSPLIIDSTTGFLGYISPSSPYIGNFDTETNTITYEDAVLRPTDSPLKNEFTNLHFRAWDSTLQEWVDVPAKYEVSNLDVGYNFTYVRIRFTWTMTSGEAATYNNFEVGADWENDFITPVQSVSSSTTFRLY